MTKISNIRKLGSIIKTHFILIFSKSFIHWQKHTLWYAEFLWVKGTCWIIRIQNKEGNFTYFKASSKLCYLPPGLCKLHRLGYSSFEFQINGIKNHMLYCDWFVLFILWVLSVMAYILRKCCIIKLSLLVWGFDPISLMCILLGSGYPGVTNF